MILLLRFPQILDVCVIVFAALATREARPADALALESDVGEGLAGILRWSHEVDPFGFFVGNDRLEDARSMRIGKSERALVSPLARVVTAARRRNA